MSINTLPNIFIIGTFGAGKSTIGNALAKLLKRTFYDTDRILEQRLGVDISWIFDVEGEMRLFEREKALLQEGEYLLFECYEVLDPDEYTDIWSDHWLQDYCTQQIKRQWGSNLIKFEGIQLPGGVTFNGQKIYDDAHAQIERMEEKMINDYSLPVMDMIG